MVLTLALALGAGVALVPEPPVQAIGRSSQVHITPLRLGSVALPWRDGLAGLVITMRRRTNVNMSSDTAPLTPRSKQLGDRPLLWTTAKGALPRLDAVQVARLRRHLTRGGTWVLDGPTAPSARAAFLASARRIAARLFPRRKLDALTVSHTVFKSFYLLRPSRLARLSGPVLGVIRDQRAVLLVVHGVAEAAHGDPSGWVREQMARLAVNLVLYALCVDYKSDQVHAPAILQRRQFRPGGSSGSPTP